MAEVAGECGACSQRTQSWHRCTMGQIDPMHVKPLCSHISCERVCMPIDGYYFCNMACVHDYNSWIVDMVGTDDTMPDDGPGNKDPQQFLMPARPRPNAPIELSPEEQDDDPVPDHQPEEGDAPEQQLEGVCNWSMRTASMQQHTHCTRTACAQKSQSPSCYPIAFRR